MGGAAAVIYTQVHGDPSAHGVVTFGAPCTKHQRSSISGASTPTGVAHITIGPVSGSGDVKVTTTCPFCYDGCQVVDECCGDTFAFTYTDTKVTVRRTDYNGGWGQNLRLRCVTGGSSQASHYDTATFDAWRPGPGSNNYPPKGYYVRGDSGSEINEMHTID